MEVKMVSKRALTMGVEKVVMMVAVMAVSLAERQVSMRNCPRDYLRDDHLDSATGDATRGKMTDMMLGLSIVEGRVFGTAS